MTATNQAEQAALTLPQRAAVALGTAEHEIRLRELAQQSCRIVEVKDPDGREEAHRAAMTLRATRTTIEKTGKAAREDATAFGKAVIAEEKRLIALIEPEESRVLALRDEWDAKAAAEKAAKIAAERARVDAIHADIDRLRAIPSALIGKSAADLAFARKDMLAMTVEESRFAEFTETARTVVTDIITRIELMLTAETEREAAALAAEQARIAEVARIEAERAELAKLRAEQAERERLAKIESDRIAAEQAAARRRLAEQEAEIQRARDAEAARVRAEQQARDAEAAEQRRQIAAQQAQLAEQQAAFAREQEEARARAEAIARRDDDHAEALALNAKFDVDREAERVRLQALADQAAADAREQAETERACSMPAGSLAPVEVERPDCDEVIGQLSVIYNMTGAEVVDMLRGFNLDEAAIRHEVAA